MIFETYVFFDIEQTGLPKDNDNKSNIIELNFLSTSKKDVIELQNNPRIENKLTLLFHPEERVIHPNSTKYSKLDNNMLKNEKPFDENAANIIIAFLKHLNGPICLVAHNGDRHDFAILKTRLDKLNIKLPDNIYCIDSLPAFRELDKKILNANQILNASQNRKDLPMLQDDEDNDNLNEETEIDNKKIQKINETTPKKQIKTSISDEDHLSFSKKIKLEKKVKEFDLSDLEYPYSLGNIYKRICDKTPSPELSHHAEYDSKMLQEIAFGYGEHFTKYAEENFKPFSKMKNLEERKQLKYF